MPPTSRRQFIKLAGTAAASAAFPPAIRRALAIPAHNATGTLRDVQHVVILMQENRSFDHYFGAMRGVRGFGDRFPIPSAGGRHALEQTRLDGAARRIVLPYHLDGAAGNAQRVNGTPHSYPDAQRAWDLGRMQQWPTHKQVHSMGFYTEAELPFQYALADAFTVCDAYHCAFHGGTNTNRLFHWTGTNDPAGRHGGPVIDNRGDALGSRDVTYRWTTYPERLQAAGIRWKVYQNLPDNFTDNPLAGFQAYRDANAVRGNRLDGSPYPPYAAADEAISPLLKGIGNTMPDGGFLQALKDDIAAGTLPQVAWIIAPAAYSEHPDPSSPVQGAWYTQQVLDALTADADVWSRTVLLVNFDENDGFFDHVPPPCAPAYDNGVLAGDSTVSTDGEYHRDAQFPDPRPCGPGPRVPMYVVSPWSRGGWVNSQVFDHTSVLRFLEARFGVAEPNISAYRRAIAGDLTSAFDFVNPNANRLPTLPRRARASADAIRATQERLPQVPAPAAPRMPVQQEGVRPSRALPYELDVHGREDAPGRALWLRFGNTGQAAAVYHVYDRLHPDRVPHRYVVEPGKALQGRYDVFARDAGRYDLFVLGPNGFHRGMRGNVGALGDPSVAAPDIEIDYDRVDAALRLTLRNSGAAPCPFTVVWNAYRDEEPWRVVVAPGEPVRRRWRVAASGNWYDITVTSPGGGFERRLAGRVETGKPSISDPAMSHPARGGGWPTVL